MKRTALLAALLFAAVALIVRASWRLPQRIEIQRPVQDVTSPEIVSAIPIEADHSIGGGASFGNLTVFPVLATTQEDFGPFVTLDDAIKAKTAVVREVAEGGPQVNRLVVENKGTTPIFVLAGTVVKGGRQDRQIAQDFVVGGGETVAADAFCVERGRWHERDGKGAVQGEFGTLKTLANSSVRAAGQYEKNQGEVWSKVGEITTATGKQTATGTLTALLDDKDIAAAQAKVASQVLAHLGKLEPQREVVGLAYAVDGKVRGARWFANHRLYEMYRATLVNTATVEAIVARGQASPGAPADAGAPASPPVPSEAVRDFVSSIEKAAPTEERATAGENTNAYTVTSQGFGSKTMMKRSLGSGGSAPPGATATAPAAKPISADFLLR
jgi:hypothetical protein